MSTRKAFTPQDLRELAAEPLDEFHPHLLDAMRGALRFCADVIDAANEALREQSALQAKEAEIAALKERLAFLTEPGALRFVEEDAGMYRVYQDRAPVENVHHFWQSMTARYYPSADEAIDSARAEVQK